MPYHGKILLGLTGNIACGKSTILKQLARLGAHTIDADEHVHRAQRKGGAAYWPVVSEFGPGILAPDGEIDRWALGQMVFADPKKLRRLEEIVHPIVRKEIERDMAEADEDVVVLDAVKLFESGWAEMCDEVWVVTCPRDAQIERLMRTRGLSREDAELRIDAQSPQAEKAERASVVIENSGSPADLQAQVAAAWRDFHALHESESEQTGTDSASPGAESR
jgi:dephospho-CoA kinase